MLLVRDRLVMKKLNFIVMGVLAFLLIAAGAQADSGFYVEAGLSYQSTSTGSPEYTASNPLGDFGFGYTFDLGDLDLNLYFKHRSSIPDTEEGLGQNFIGFELRRYFR